MAYVQGGKGVRSYLENQPNLQRRLGWADSTMLKPGTAKLQPKAKQKPLSWQDLRIHFKFELAEPNPTAAEGWIQCKYTIARSGDMCSADSWIFLTHCEKTSAGRIITILSRKGLPLSSDNILVIVQLYNIDERKDSRLNMPVLFRPEVFPVKITPDEILFIFNAQHDCVKGGCKVTTDDQNSRQERQETAISKKILSHSPLDRFFVNMHALHNAHLIREALPRHLSMPIPFLEDRSAEHMRTAGELQVSGPIRRAASKKKAAETRARNAEAKRLHTLGTVREDEMEE